MPFKSRSLKALRSLDYFWNGKLDIFSPTQIEKTGIEWTAKRRFIMYSINVDIIEYIEWNLLDFASRLRASELMVFPSCLDWLNVVKCQSMFVTTGYDGDWPGTEQSRVTGTWPRPGAQGPSLHQTEQRTRSQPQTAGARDGPHGPRSSHSPHLETSLHTLEPQGCTNLGTFDPNMNHFFFFFLVYRSFFDDRIC